MKVTSQKYDVQNTLQVTLYTTKTGKVRENGGGEEGRKGKRKGRKEEKGEKKRRYGKKR